MTCVTSNSCLDFGSGSDPVVVQGFFHGIFITAAWAKFCVKFHK